MIPDDKVQGCDQIGTKKMSKNQSYNQKILKKEVKEISCQVESWRPVAGPSKYSQ